MPSTLYQLHCELEQHSGCLFSRVNQVIDGYYSSGTYLLALGGYVERKRSGVGEESIHFSFLFFSFLHFSLPSQLEPALTPT